MGFPEFVRSKLLFTPSSILGFLLQQKGILVQANNIVHITHGCCDSPFFRKSAISRQCLDTWLAAAKFFFQCENITFLHQKTIAEILTASFSSYANIKKREKKTYIPVIYRT